MNGERILTCPLVSPPRVSGIRTTGKGPDLKRDRFTQERIIGALREQAAGAVVAELCHKHGMPSATFYGWKAKYDGMDVSDAKRLKALEDGNAKLKRIMPMRCSTMPG